jgi:dipeptidase D
MTLHEDIRSLVPQMVWGFMADLLGLPRSSGKEHKLRMWLVEWAKLHNVGCVQELPSNNMYLDIPASPGKEDAPTVVLQFHGDMVCEKLDSFEFDFETEVIPAFVDGDKVWTGGKTTTGFDNGIGLAAGLAAATDPECVHPHLVILVTMDEETGLTGAKGFNPAKLEDVRRMINLDSEHRGTVFTGCAGGANVKAVIPIKRQGETEGRTAFQFTVSGCTGGHSGLQINRRGASAVYLLYQLLDNLNAQIELELVNIDGGPTDLKKTNVIAKEGATMIVMIPDDQLDDLQNSFQDFRSEVLGGYFVTDPDLDITYQKLDHTDLRPMDVRSTSELASLLGGLPYGVESWSREVDRLVHTSVNQAIIHSSQESITVVMSFRSMNDEDRDSFVDMTMTEILDYEHVFKGLVVKVEDSYPGWQPDP